MKNKIVIVVALLLQTTAFAIPPGDGKTIFMSRCASCHNVNKKVVGPALAGVDQRRSIDWIIKFVHSSQTLIKSGDTAAMALYQTFNKVPMPDHPDLSNDDIKMIVEFIKLEAKPAGGDNATKRNNPGKSLFLEKNYGSYIGLMVAIIMLIGTLLFAVRVSKWKKEIVLKKTA